MTRTSLMTVLVAFLLPAIIGCKKDETIVTPVNTDKVKLGQTVDAGSSVITSSGGTITVSRPGSPVDGMTITVPANAYPDSRTFSIAYAPIESHQFGADFVPISPMIMIRNGGGYAQDPMQVKIPVHIASNQFALGFFYNEKTKTLEAMGLVDQDSASITVETRHFDASGVSGTTALKSSDPRIQDAASIANVIVGVIDRDRIAAMSTISSGFTPGVDDWEFVNMGSFLAPGGHCAGESMTAMWYYYECKLKNAPKLFHTFDRINASKDVMWQDNRQGYAWASAVQCDFNWDDWIARVTLAKGHGPENLLAFAFSMLVTHEPQFVLIRNSVNHGGHAMVVYAVSPSEGMLYIADPNKPGDKTARITMSGGVFQPYTTGLRADGTPVDFDQIGWFAKTSYITWNQITTRYNQFAAGTIRDLVFPPYTWWVKDGSGYELVDGLNTDADSLPLEIRNFNPALFTKIGFLAYDTAGTVLNNLTGSVTLHSGKNVIGLNIVGEPALECDGTVPTNHDYQWVDFKWYTIYREGLSIRSSDAQGLPFDAPGKSKIPYTLIAASTGARPAAPRYEWNFGDGTAVALITGDSTVEHTFPRAGTFLVTVQLFNSTTNVKVSSGSRNAVIRDSVKIISITPDTISWGSTAEIRGTGFGATQGTSYIDFSGAKTATITVWSDSLIRFVLPDSASGGWLQVVINGTHSNLVRYWVRRPTIDRVDPTHGKAGTVVRLIGRGFGPTQRNSLVKFSSPNDTVIPATFWSDTLIITAIPTTVQYYGGFKAYFTVYQKGTVNSNSGAIYIDRDWYRTAQRCTSQASSWTSKNFYTGRGTTVCQTTSINESYARANPLVWTDSSFTMNYSGTSGSSTVVVSVSGTISSDGTLLKTLRATHTETNSGGVTVIRRAMSFTNVPIDTTTSQMSWMEFKINGPAAQSHASQLEDYFNNTMNLEYSLSSTVWDDPQCRAEVRFVLQ